MDAVDGFDDLVARTLSAPTDILNLLHRARLYIAGLAATIAAVLTKM